MFISDIRQGERAEPAAGGAADRGDWQPGGGYCPDGGADSGDESRE